jgi:hypothetical protein
MIAWKPDGIRLGGGKLDLPTTHLAINIVV